MTKQHTRIFVGVVLLGFFLMASTAMAQTEIRVETPVEATAVVQVEVQAETPAAGPIDLGSKRELFMDDFLVGSMTNTEILVHQPVREEVAIQSVEPWEGNACGYFVMLYDEQAKIYRSYCHAWNHHPFGRLLISTYESKDGIHWTRPNVGTCEYNGSKENNIVLDRMGDGDSCHDFAPFIDRNPAAKPEARYKATGAAIHTTRGVWAYQSPDGLHWTPMHDGPVFTEGAFDTQNVSFWSEKEQKYVLYYRVFIDGVRAISRAVSDDFIHWTNEGPLQFPEGEGPVELVQYYVNQVQPYYRAPHLYIGFPVRYVDHGMTPSNKLLPEWEEREMRFKEDPRLGTALTDSIYMTSRDGMHFRISNDVFLQPGLRTRHNWSYGDNYLAYRVLETDSVRDDMPRELSLYATESHSTGKSSRLRRYTLRIDGFGSIHAKTKEGEMRTKPLVFTGSELSINAATSAAGGIRVEILDEAGQPIPGYTLEDCDLIYGDSLDRVVTWKENKDVSALADKPVVLRFVMKEADLYSLIFRTEAEAKAEK